jgi:uncharacterized coiled-coil protein SlyX
MDIEARVKLLEDKSEAQEQIIAQLTMAYAEVWMVVQSLLEQVLFERSEEEKTEFWKNLDDVRSKLVVELNKASAGDVESVDPDLIEAMERLVKGKRDTPPS